MALPLDAKANDLAIKQLKELANYQLTDKQYACHNEIIYRESRWDYKAVGNLKGTKRVYGLYQMKTESLKKSTPIKQFWMYWHYVAHRYGHTEYDEPAYCNALHHLKTKGWQ
jgi:S-adenosylmethionine:diacylglycerol 3-amino-3-carboxypropyl transferase